MSVLFGKRQVESRSISYQDVWGSGGSPDLRGDSLQVALGLVPVYAATSLIADAVAASPWAVYQKNDGGVPQKLATQPALVTDPCVDGLDVFSWKHQALTSALLRGNAYGLILDVDRSGVPSKIKWLHPDKVEVDEDGPVPLFFWNGRLIDRLDLIHIPAYTVAGSVKGLSPITQFRLQIETGSQAQTFGRNFYKRGTVPPGWLTYVKNKLTAETASEAKRRFLASVSSNEPMVSGDDWKYEPIAVPQGDAQFLAGIKATANQIAAVYRVAPEDVGGSTDGQSLTYKNLEQDQIRFAVRTLRPWTERFESVLNRHLPANQYVKFNLDASARADLLTRFDAHSKGIAAGFETIDEVRALEERAPLTDVQRQQFLEMKPTIGTTP